MHITFRRHGNADEGPDWVGVHVHANTVSINPEADGGSYLSLEDVDEGPSSLYRLRREGMAVVRDPVAGGIEEDHARWWMAEELGDGDYQAIVSDGKHRQVLYIGIGKDNQFWTLDEDPIASVEFQFWDVDSDGWPDIAALAAALPTDVV
jgi:hypothetical protein